MIERTYRKNKSVLHKLFYFSPLILQTFIWPATRFILRFFGHLKIEGLDNLREIKKGQGVIFVANHTSELDPILLPASLPFLSKLMPIFYTSREKSFYANSGWRQIFYGGCLFKLWGAHPIRPGLKDYEKSLETHIRLVEEGKSVLIFPEGKKTGDGLIHPENAKGGVGFMAHKTDRVVVPIRIDGVYNLSFIKFFSFKSYLKIKFLDPVHFNDFLKEDQNNLILLETYKTFSTKILEKIRVE